MHPNGVVVPKIHTTKANRHGSLPEFMDVSQFSGVWTMFVAYNKFGTFPGESTQEVSLSGLVG